MNYQILLESYAAGEWINKDELSLLELELDSQLESIKFSRTQGCTEKAPKHICEAAQVCEGSSWITCFALGANRGRRAFVVWDSIRSRERREVRAMPPSPAQICPRKPRRWSAWLCELLWFISMSQSR